MYSQAFCAQEEKKTEGAIFEESGLFTYKVGKASKDLRRKCHVVTA